MAENDNVVLVPLFNNNGWNVSLQIKTSRIFVEKKVKLPSGKITKQTVPVWVRHVWLILQSRFGTEVRFHPYRHKANGGLVKFSDSRIKELKSRGPKSMPLSPNDLIQEITPWIKELAPNAVKAALDAFDDKQDETETNAQTEQNAAA